MTGKLVATGALAVVAVAVWVSQGRIGSGRGSDPGMDVQARPSDATRGQAAAPTETAPAVDSRLAVDWWNRAIEAAGESAAGIRAAALLRGLGEMPEVAKTLGNRRGGLRPEVLFRKIPAGVLLAGEGAALNYLSERDLSHIRSVHEAPELVAEPGNVVFERTHSNRARGGRNMTNWEWAVAHADSVVAGARAGARVVAVSMVRGVANGALLNLPVAATVETLHVVNERKTVGESRAAVEAYLKTMQDMIRDHVATIGDSTGSAIESLQETLESALAPVN